MTDRAFIEICFSLDSVSNDGSVCDVHSDECNRWGDMSLDYAFHDNPLPLLSRGAGAYATGPVANPGQVNNLLAMVYVSAGSGTTHTLDVVIQTSPDRSTWTTVTSGTQITGATGTQLLYAYVGSDLYAQVQATVGGTGTPTKTFNIGVLVL